MSVLKIVHEPDRTYIFIYVCLFTVLVTEQKKLDINLDRTIVLSNHNLSYTGEVVPSVKWERLLGFGLAGLKAIINTSQKELMTDI